MKRYYVTYMRETYYGVYVDAESEEEAQRIVQEDNELFRTEYVNEWGSPHDICVYDEDANEEVA